MSERIVLVWAMSALALAACEPVEPETSEGPAPHASPSGLVDAAVASENAAEESIDAPRPMLQLSAWRAEGADGAIYSTFLDPEGRYRDLKNGNLYQEGDWEVRTDGALCFLPDGENVRGDCWELASPEEDGAIIATHSSGRRVELQRIDYRVPEEE